MNFKSGFAVSAILSVLAGSAFASAPDVETISVAAPEIIPPTYHIYYGAGVDPGADVIVSHNKRASWRARLDTALAGTGMSWSISNHTVSIDVFGAVANPSPAPLGSRPVAATQAAESSGFTMTQYTPPAPPLSPQSAVTQTRAQPGFQIVPYAPPPTPPPVRAIAAQNIAPDFPSTPAVAPPHAQTSVIVAAANIAAVQVPPPAPVWTLKVGELASRNIMDWAKQAGWQVTWSFPKDFVIAHPATFTGNFQTAAEKVITLLHEQLEQFDQVNANIHYDAYPSNKQFVVDTFNSGGN